jgi:hypothetical protein
LAKHTEFHEILRGKKNKYDGVVRLGKLIKDRAPKTDNSTLKLMESDMKAKWQSVCNKSIDRQRKLEEGLLFSGQFEDAIKVSFFCFQNFSFPLYSFIFLLVLELIGVGRLAMQSRSDSIDGRSRSRRFGHCDGIARAAQ